MPGPLLGEDNKDQWDTLPLGKKRHIYTLVCVFDLSREREWV